MTRALSASLALALTLALAACQSAEYHRRAVEDSEGRRVTAGTVQREIRVGMSGAEVAEVLGSPNIVTTDEERREVWVYDRISTTSVYSTSSGGTRSEVQGGRIFTSVPSLIFGSLGARSEGSAGANATSQKTFTVVIKYDDAGQVRDFAYHVTRF